ncbi:hypothetical protein T484DRAFT_2423808 [Baffinella frigidus]|nr:hypothetical protein T484DRAFT_2423808 [Cryptophyta sp. CCMP2293]
MTRPSATAEQGFKADVPARRVSSGATYARERAGLRGRALGAEQRGSLTQLMQKWEAEDVRKGGVPRSRASPRTQSLDEEGAAEPEGEGAAEPAGEGAGEPAGEGAVEPAGEGAVEPAGEGAVEPQAEGGARGCATSRTLSGCARRASTVIRRCSGATGRTMRSLSRRPWRTPRSPRGRPTRTATSRRRGTRSTTRSTAPTLPISSRGTRDRSLGKWRGSSCARLSRGRWYPLNPQP